MVVFPHQISCESCDYRPAQANLCDDSFFSGIALKFTNESVVAVCTHPDLKPSFHWLVGNVLLHCRAAFEGHHCLVNTLFPIRPVVGAAGSQHCGNDWAYLTQMIWWE